MAESVWDRIGWSDKKKEHQAAPAISTFEGGAVHVIPVDGTESSDKAFEWAHRNSHPKDKFYIIHGR